MRKIILILLLTNPIFSFSQSLTINVAENHFRIDETNLLIVSQIEDIKSYNDLSSFEEIIISLDSIDFICNTPPISINYNESYIVTNSVITYTLYFTQLPIISIKTTNTIVNEPKTLALLTYSDSVQVVSSNIGIELRGGSSLGHPKKKYDIEFWVDENGEDTRKVKFGNLRSDDDWILDGMYNQPLRLRSNISNKLWLAMHTPYYQEYEPEAKPGVDVEYIELFIDNNYKGIYNLSEQVDKKQLKIKSFKDEIRGELYKGTSWGATTFTSLPIYNDSSNLWGGYEVKYPKDNDTINWKNLYSFTDFVMNSTDSDFTDSIWNEFNHDNYLDYFIFLNLLRATDNTGKNIYIAKYKTDEPYFYTPWDLDGCFGTIWNGTNENITDDILVNNFHKRVIELNPNDYSIAVSNKWEEYRDSILNTEELISMFENQYLFLLENKIYERESIVFPNYEFNRQDLDYLLTWLQDRLAFLDDYFGYTLATNSEKLENEKIYIYPNPATSFIYFNNSKEIENNEYKIFDLWGSIVQEGIISEKHISIERLDKGAYILVLDERRYKLTVK